MAKTMVLLFSSNLLMSDIFSRHANLPQLAGCSSDRSAMQFILFHDAYDLSRHTAEIRSLAAFLLEFTRLHDALSLANKMIDFVSIFLWPVDTNN